jgi:hypothetical protein
MKYLLLGFRDEDRWSTATATQRADFAATRRHFDQELRATGSVLAECAIAADDDVFLFRAPGRPDMPGGADKTRSLRELIVIEARDLNEAIRIASNHPAARIGEPLGWLVEIRPLESFAATHDQR